MHLRVGWALKAQLQLEVGALLGRAGATSFTAAGESPIREAMPAQARLARSDCEREPVACYCAIHFTCPQPFQLGFDKRLGS